MPAAELPARRATHALPSALLAASSLFAVAWVYRELPRVYFAADDFLNLFQIVNRPLLEYLLQSHGGHILVTRNALFFLFHLLFGTAAESYLYIVLITHLVNVALLFRVIRRLTLSPHLAAFGATLWGICPMHADALGWYSVYGHVVVGTALLFLLDRASRASREGTPLPSASVVLWPLLLLLASTSFGVGIGIAAVSPAVFFLILPPSRQRTALCVVLSAAVLALPFLYDALLSLHGSLTGKQLARPSMMANLFPALRYWELTGLMTAYLLDFGVAGLLFGFFRVDATFPTAHSAVAAVVFAAAVLLVLVRADAVTRRWIVALLLVVVATYGIIAVGRANFFLSSTMGKAATAGRYHYVATMPLALLLCLLLARIGDAVALRGGAGLAVLAIWAGLTGLGYARAPRLLDLHDWQRRETMSVLQAFADMAASDPSPKLYIANRRFQAAGVFISRHETQFPGWAAIYSIFFPANELMGKQVHFVVDDPAVAVALQGGRRTAGLIVAHDRVPDGEIVLTPKPLAASEAVP